jgi:hypothetical protein
MYIGGQDNIMCRCWIALKTSIIVKELHEGVARGHFVVDIGGQLY